ncbi:hypothetical protein [Longirhabdus pacifica]|uniref:hypothetical protein n=1 Tax=Longirhabdus pacifica TaxID=2305227 RepID=UPI001008811D|nr:hypothetical protein [Longirhabdus pacifica]
MTTTPPEHQNPFASNPFDSNALSTEQPFQGMSEAPATLNDIPVKHSKLGIASFILGVLNAIVIMIILSIATYFTSQEQLIINMQPEEQQTDYIVTGFVFIILFLMGFLLTITGLGLGIASLVIKNTKKVFGIIGTVMGGVPVIMYLFLILLGI